MRDTLSEWFAALFTTACIAAVFLASYGALALVELASRKLRKK